MLYSTDLALGMESVSIYRNDLSFELHKFHSKNTSYTQL